ncbi:MAG: CHAT domain-containing protein [Planctomycetota bacterium]
MPDIQNFIDRIERGDIEPLCQELLETGVQQQVLREYFGGNRYDRLRNLALKRHYGMSSDSPSKDLRATNNVLVVPGFSGSRLAVSRDGVEQTLWFDLAALSAGGLDQLKLAELSSMPTPAIRAGGLLKRSYGELLLTLAARWNVRSFAYDWRLDLEGIADKLARRAAEWFGRDEPFHIVAFGMGALVARLMTVRHKDLWTPHEESQEHKHPTRLVMVGAPNHGSLIALQMLTGLDTTVRKLAQLDERHSNTSIASIFGSFPSVYQLLPSLASEEDNAWLYEAERYLAETAGHQLERAAEIHHLLAEAVDPRRMINVAGSGQPTPVAAYRSRDLATVDGYKYSLRGDGRVSHEANALERDGEMVPTYYVDAGHGRLTSHPLLLAALGELLVDGRTKVLPTRPPSVSMRLPSTQDSLRKGIEEKHEEQRTQLADAMASVRTANTDARGSRTAANTTQRFDPARVILNDYLDDRGDRQDVRSVTAHFEPAEIQIRVVQASIEDIGDADRGNAPPIDAISVGHYLGVEPQTAELALDRAISSVLGDGEDRLLLTELAARGTLSGQHAQLFVLPDPRQGDSRVVAIAGMGLPGRLGIPELVVLARELCWALGRMGKRHLATVLIGAGSNTLDPATAIDAWLRGMKLALTGTRPGDCGVLECVTFVCHGDETSKILRERIAKVAEVQNERQRWHIRFDSEEATNSGASRGKSSSASSPSERDSTQNDSRAESAPTRITATLEGQIYRFGAIMQQASIPERNIALDTGLVDQVNDSLVSATLIEQYHNGLFLQKLVLPDDFREHVQSDAPLVLMLDNSTARIHWEMMVGSSLDAPRAESLGPGSNSSDFQDMFWGTGRGLTRQLRTTFAPPPEPPPPMRRLLRVLIVADPAEDQPLIGAQQEGFEIAELFESYNQIHADSPNRVEVVRLLGPHEATRINVMRHLMLRTYDVLHFAGHCQFHEDDITRSGWLFSGGELITARELSRIDRVPKFVFSNACESGVTTLRPERRHSGFAPSFAEAVFLRGVSNFICTAWPVNDTAARHFAHTLYANLLNVVPRSLDAPTAPRLTMHQAMREARLAIAATAAGETTWGAYQHYGHPNHRFFSALTTERE